LQNAGLAAWAAVKPAAKIIIDATAASAGNLFSISSSFELIQVPSMMSHDLG
jgi:hypothetical protein